MNIHFSNFVGCCVISLDFSLYQCIQNRGWSLKNGQNLVLTMKLIKTSDLQHEILHNDVISDQRKKFQHNNQKRMWIPALGTYEETQSVNLGSISFELV